MQIMLLPAAWRSFQGEAGRGLGQCSSARARSSEAWLRGYTRWEGAAQNRLMCRSRVEAKGLQKARRTAVHGGMEWHIVATCAHGSNLYSP